LLRWSVSKSGRTKTFPPLIVHAAQAFAVDLSVASVYHAFSHKTNLSTQLHIGQGCNLLFNRSRFITI
jgi:hypothetical protein